MLLQYEIGIFTKYDDIAALSIFVHVEVYLSSLLSNVCYPRSVHSGFGKIFLLVIPLEV